MHLRSSQEWRRRWSLPCLKSLRRFRDPVEGLSKAHFLDYGKLYALTDLAMEEFVQWARELGADAADVEVWAQGPRRLTQAAELGAEAAQRGGGRGKKEATRGTAAGRADRDKRKRKKAVAKLVHLVDFLDLPFAVRPMRIRTWTKLQTWLEATLGRSWPHSVNDDVLGYLECLASGGKSAGALLQVLQAVRLMGAAGEVRAEDCIGYSTQLPSRTRDFGRARPKGKARRIPVMVLFAHMLVVWDTVRPVYIRGFEWVKLLKFWASLRCDDLQWLALFQQYCY